MWEVERSEVVKKLGSGKYRVYLRKTNVKAGKLQNLGTFETRDAAEHQERAVQILRTQRMMAREGIFSSVLRVLHCTDLTDRC